MDADKFRQKENVRRSSLGLLLFFFFDPVSLLHAKTKSLAAKANRPEVSAEESPRSAPRFAAGLAIGIPHPLEVRGVYLQNRNVSHTIGYGYFELHPKSGSKVQDLKITMQHFEYKYRYEPEKRPVYLQLGIGYQSIDASGRGIAKFSQGGLVAAIPFDAEMQIQSIYYTPKVGVKKHFANGLSLAWGFGYMVPAYIQSRFKAKISDDPLLNELVQEVASFNESKKKIERTGKRLGQFGLPHIDVIEVNWRFQ